MRDEFRLSLLHHLFEQTINSLPGGAIIDGSGRALVIKSVDLIDLGTFPTAAQLSDQYLQLKDSDIVLLNDPFSGGSHLSSMTLVLGCESALKQSKGKKMFLCSRLPFRPALGDGAHLDQEGIRIPPAPLLTNGELNRELIGILSQHPLCPTGFESEIKKSVTQLQARHRWLVNTLKQLNLKVDEHLVSQFHKRSELLAKEVLDDISIGEAKSEISFDRGKTKLSLEVKSEEKCLSFDFTGSTASDDFNLTETATFGSCVGAVYSTLGVKVPMNYGSMQSFQVTTPKDSLVHAEYPKPIFWGMIDGPGLVAGLVLKLIGQIDPRKQIAQTGLSLCSIELVFKNGSKFFDQVQMGNAANREQSGYGGLDPWRRPPLNPSIEAAESRFPIRVVSHSYRQKSGGSGRHVGGDGVTRKLQILEDATIHWRVFDEFKKNEGLEGGKTGKGPEVSIEIPGQGQQSLSRMGSKPISKGTTVTLHSAGGGGYGEDIDDELG